jgi:hypothetical protein
VHPADFPNLNLPVSGLADSATDDLNLSASESHWQVAVFTSLKSSWAPAPGANDSTPRSTGRSPVYTECTASVLFLRPLVGGHDGSSELTSAEVYDLSMGERRELPFVHTLGLACGGATSEKRGHDEVQAEQRHH